MGTDKGFQRAVAMANVNPFLCIVIACVVVMSAFVSWYFFKLYQHPIEKEKGAAWPQAVIIFSLTFTLLAVLLPPLDIANGNGGIPMDTLWYIIFYVQATMIFIVIPYSIFYYGAYDSFGTCDDEGNVVAPETCQPEAWRSAACSTLVTAGVSMTIIGVVWIFVGKAELKVMAYSSSLKDISGATGITMAPQAGCAASECVGVEEDLVMDVTFPVYTIAITAFLGWTLFSVFAGVGLFAVPMDFINYYRSRVTFMNARERDEFKLVLGKKAEVLHKFLRDIEKNMEGKEEISAEDAEQLKKYLKDKDLIFQQYQNFKICEDACNEVHQEDNACYHCLGLWAGILAVLVSLLWTIHIFMYMFWEDPVYGFLNDFLVRLDQVWPFFGVTLYAVFTFYLMLCVLKGNARWGLSIGCCSLHPLEVRNTLMQSFLVNTLLLAVVSFSVVQFCMQAFKGYAGPNSSATILFNVAAKNLRGLTYLYSNNVFVYILLICSGLTFLALLWAPGELNLTEKLKQMNEEAKWGSSNVAEKGKTEIEMETHRRGYGQGGEEAARI